MAVRDETMPAGKWEFDSSVTDAFDDMLNRSIPAYNIMRELTTRLALRFIPTDKPTTVLDLGCSRGGALAPLVDVRPGLPVDFVGVDVSVPMIDAARSRFRGDRRVTIAGVDLRTSYPVRDEETVSVTLAVLTLQFVPIEHRDRVLRDAYRMTIPGGVLIVVEKVLGRSVLHDVFDAEYLAFKGRSGYSDEAIARKRASLEGVLVSRTSDENVTALYDAGFRTVDCFYRWLNFAGWIAVKR